MAEGFYFARRTEVEPGALLRAENDGWSRADRISWGSARYRTSFRALWSSAALSLRFDAVDPDPWHTMTNRDDRIWEEEVVEIFLDLDGSGRNYAEVELSPVNVVTDVRMVRTRPEREGDLEWDFEGLGSRVEPFDGGWTGLIQLPWDGFRSLPSATGVSLPPEPGDQWRFNVYRIERPGGPQAPDRGARFHAYSPTGDPSFHVPAAFQGFVFA